MSVVAARQTRGEPFVTRDRLDIMRRKAFAVVGPSATCKSFYFGRDWAGSDSE